MEPERAWEFDPGELEDGERVSLCEVLDRILNKGAVVAGEIVISVANVDLLYLGLQLVVTSVETARRTGMGGVGLLLEVGKENTGAIRDGSPGPV